MNCRHDQGDSQQHDLHEMRGHGERHVLAEVENDNEAIAISVALGADFDCGVLLDDEVEKMLGYVVVLGENERVLVALDELGALAVNVEHARDGVSQCVHLCRRGLLS